MRGMAARLHVRVAGPPMLPQTGMLYRRRDLHAQVGGQMQGGISTPKGHPLVLIFASSGGKAFGYQDGFQADGTYSYTGEGTAGDMQLVRGNAAIRDHEKNNRHLFLFEGEARGMVRCSGEFRYVRHTVIPMLDMEQRQRDAIVFTLERLVQGAHPNSAGTELTVKKVNPWKIPLPKLRTLALTSSTNEKDPIRRIRLIHARSEAVAAYVQRRANGVCECCGDPAPFLRPDGRPYLEAHHLDMRSDGGPDHPDHVAAICPNCHRAVHYAEDAEVRNEALRRQLKQRQGGAA